MLLVCRSHSDRFLDIRLRVAYCLGLVVLGFAAPGWLPLMVVTLACMVSLAVSGLPLRRCLRAWWSLRWLLLFTILMHLLFSPGQMLFGSRWLSYDGLLRGLFVCQQISLAVFAAQLLSFSGRPDQLAAALGWFLSPLQRLGCPTDLWQKQVALVLHFIPRARLAFADDSGAGPGQRKSNRTSPLQGLVQRLIRMIDRLIVEADLQARRIQTGQDTPSGGASWTTFHLFSPGNMLAVSAALLWLIGYVLAARY